MLLSPVAYWPWKSHWKIINKVIPIKHQPTSWTSRQDLDSQHQHTQSVFSAVLIKIVLSEITRPPPQRNQRQKSNFALVLSRWSRLKSLTRREVSTNMSPVHPTESALLFACYLTNQRSRKLSCLLCMRLFRRLFTEQLTVSCSSIVFVKLLFQPLFSSKSPSVSFLFKMHSLRSPCESLRLRPAEHRKNETRMLESFHLFWVWK